MPNKPSRIHRRLQLPDLVRQLRTAEQSLLKGGVTVGQVAESIGCSPRQARRYVEMLRDFGCEITNDYVTGSNEPGRLKATRGTRLFR